MIRTESEDALHQLLRTQHGFLTGLQARNHGFSRRRIQHLVESGQWTCVLHGVYCVTTGPLTRPMVLSAALVYAGGRAVLSHHTAAEEWGMLRLRSDANAPVHVTVPYGLSCVSQSPTIALRPPNSTRPVPAEGRVLHPGVHVHRSRAFRHITVAAQPARTSRADTVLDIAAGEATADEAYDATIGLVTNARLSVPLVRKRVAQRPPWRHSAAIDAALDLLADGVQSVLEFHYSRDVEQAHGLPTSRKQSPVFVDGQVLYEDCDYSDSGVRLIVRLDGRAFHSSSTVAFRDRRRDNAAELAARPRLVYGWEEVNRTPCAVATEVRAVLLREGWAGPNPCGLCNT